MTQERLFQDKVVVVAGGGAGLGRQYVLDLAAAGARVVVGGRSASAELTASDARKAGGDAVSCLADVRNGERMIQTALETYGRLDGLIVNAGVVRDRSFLKMSPEDWAEVLEIHLGGTYACVRAAWPHMLAQQFGRIVLTISGAAMYGNFGQANYSAAKGAIIGFMRTLAIEGGPKNVFVNALGPIASTGMTESVFDDRQKALLDPKGVSPYALALLHDRSAENGSIIEAGGGWAARIRLERSAGLRLAGTELSPETVLRRWSEVIHFDDSATHPAAIPDCLSAAMGTNRS
ncbi:MAG TPA: SDR family NAD(P)-dependent oxidoreductase [Vicinamibacterales bacterium]|nr:SDR family NAD(P)-dependent oxidoreductase [Vicinamibacterales bacterium]